MNLKKLFGAGLVAGAFTLSSIGAASATAMFDPASGTGTVGKGDVQIPFGWNNAQLQANATGVDFLYVDVTEYDVTCETTVTVQEQAGNSNRTVTKKVKVRNFLDANTTVAYDSATATKKNPKGSVVGFVIESTSPVSSDDAPEVGDSCTMDDGTSGKIVVVDIASTIGDTVYATHSTKADAAVWVDGVSVY